MAILPVIFIACRHSGTAVGGAMHRIDSLASANPQNAIAALDSIDKNSLPSDEHTVYDLLFVKTRDKAYVMHTTDSIILDVIGRLNSDDPYGLLPEALYYGGRVYSDMGDYPTSLQYFQQSLESFPENPDSAVLKLKSSVLSQTGRLLESLHMYEQALPYVEQAIEINRLQRNRINEMYDLELLGDIYMKRGLNRESRALFREAASIASTVSPIDVWQNRMYMARTFLGEGEIDSALYYIQGVKENVDSFYTSSALCYETKIYKKAGMLDSAYKSAMQMLALNNKIDSHIAYYTLLSPEMSGFLPPDSLPIYVRRFYRAIKSHLERYESEQTIQQLSIYNYAIHDKEKTKAEIQSAKYVHWLMAACVALAAAAFLSLLFLYWGRTKELQRLKSVNDLKMFKTEVKQAGGDWLGKNILNDLISDEVVERRTSLRKKIIESIRNNPDYDFQPELKGSPIYYELNRMIYEHCILKGENSIWRDINSAIDEYCPKFMPTIRILADKKLSEDDFRMLWLIRIGISPSKIAILAGRTKSTITRRRESLSIKLLGEIVDLGAFDNMIRRLDQLCS